MTISMKYFHIQGTIKMDIYDKGERVYIALENSIWHCEEMDYERD